MVRRPGSALGPAHAALPLFNEALGTTNESYPYVNLSDGGHFDNLGLYEMVLRRCRYIMVVDAGCDSDYVFEDLGNAIRKIRIDSAFPSIFKPSPQKRRARGLAIMPSELSGIRSATAPAPMVLCFISNLHSVARNQPMWPTTPLRIPTSPTNLPAISGLVSRKWKVTAPSDFTPQQPSAARATEYHTTAEFFSELKMRGSSPVALSEEQIPMIA